MDLSSLAGMFEGRTARQVVQLPPAASIASTLELPLTNGLGRAMLRDVPLTNEIQVKGNTPWVDCRPLVPRGAARRIDRFRAVAFAYRHVTRMAVPGQRTGRVCHTQEAIGVRS